MEFNKKKYDELNNKDIALMTDREFKLYLDLLATKNSMNPQNNIDLKEEYNIK